MNRERELKYRVAADFAWPELPGFPEIATAFCAPAPVVSRYFDTAERHLAVANASLRHRDSDGWTVKLPEARSGARLDRLEFQFGAGDQQNADRPPRDALTLLRGILRGTAVEVAAQLRVMRSDARFKPTGADYTLLLVDDRVEIIRSDGANVCYRELEIELEGDVPDEALKAIDRALRRAGADASAPQSKYQAALGQQPEPLLPPRVLGDDSSAAELIGEAIAASARRILERDPMLRLNADAQSIHQTRVATRRLRSHLRTFRPLLDPQWIREVEPDLRNFARRLGKVRNLDVLFEGLLERAAELGSDDREIAERLLESLPIRREQEMEPLEFFLSSDTYVSLLDRLIRGSQIPPVPDDSPAREHVGAIARRPWKRALRAAKHLGPDSSDAELHKFRILIKRCRYAAEAVAPVAGKAARRWASELTKLQDVLGLHQDACHAQTWLREQMAQLPADEAFVAGQLYERERRRAELHRAAWRNVWKRVKRGQDWLR